MDTNGSGKVVSLGLVMFGVGVVVAVGAMGFVVTGVGPSPPLVNFTSAVSLDSGGDDELRLVVSAGGFDGAFVSVEGVEGEGVVESREYNRGDVVVVDGSDVI